MLKPTQLDARGMPVIDMAAAKPVFKIRVPMERLANEVCRVTVDIFHAGQKTSMTLDIEFCMPDGKPMPDDWRFAYARDYVNRLFEALSSSHDPDLSNLD